MRHHPRLQGPTHRGPQKFHLLPRAEGVLGTSRTGPGAVKALVLCSLLWVCPPVLSPRPCPMSLPMSPAQVLLPNLC